MPSHPLVRTPCVYKLRRSQRTAHPRHLQRTLSRRGQPMHAHTAQQRRPAMPTARRTETAHIGHDMRQLTASPRHHGGSARSRARRGIRAREQAEASTSSHAGGVRAIETHHHPSTQTARDTKGSSRSKSLGSRMPHGTRSASGARAPTRRHTPQHRCVCRRNAADLQLAHRSSPLSTWWSGVHTSGMPAPAPRLAATVVRSDASATRAASAARRPCWR